MRLGSDPEIFLRNKVGKHLSVIGKVGGNNSVGYIRPGVDISLSDVVLEPIPTLYSDQQDLAASVLLNTSPGTAVSDSPPVIMPVTQAVTVPATTVVDNTAMVPNSGLSKKQIGWGLAGLAALYLVTRKENNSVGKKKNKKSVLPLVLGVGALGYWLYTRNQAAAVPSTDTTPNTTQAPVIPITAPVQTAPPIVAPIDVQTAARGFTASVDMTALQRDWPGVAGSLPVMTDLEVIQMYNYYYNFVQLGLKLYRDPGTYGDGSWNTTLYDAIASIRAKYNLNI